jgi:hypothetical protein
MTIKNSVVRRIAYMTRQDMLKVPSQVLNTQPLTSTKSLPSVEGRCGVGWRAYSPFDGLTVQHAIVPAMPLQIGRDRRNHGTAATQAVSR